jgi:uncharacterized protein YdhG (YjbR/CyaY superfamily)
MTKSSDGFSKAEQAAMKQRAKELKAEARASRKRADGEAAVLAAIAEMPETDRALAEWFHAIVARMAPELWPKTWYGMPAYSVGGKTVVCFFQGAAKFEARYATIGFNDAATLDEGSMWPVSFAITEPDEANEQRISDLVRRAAS